MPNQVIILLVLFTSPASYNCKKRTNVLFLTIQKIKALLNYAIYQQNLLTIKKNRSEENLLSPDKLIKQREFYKQSANNLSLTVAIIQNNAVQRLNYQLDY